MRIADLPYRQLPPTHRDFRGTSAVEGGRYLDETVEIFARRIVKEPYQGGKWEGLTASLAKIGRKNFWDAQVRQLSQTRDSDVIATDEPIAVALAFRWAKERMAQRRQRFVRAIFAKAQQRNRRAA